MNDKIREKLKTLPHCPGSYQYRNIEGEIIYVGKAKDLYNRVRSYFIGAHDFKTTKLVSEIDDLEYIITSTEKEALILEINLIKKYVPKYNISLTDDKRYPYIVVTNEANPRILYTRDIKKVKGKVYGPYPNATSAKEVWDLLNRMYPLRKCRSLPKKECLYYHMGQCLAPCINKIKKEEYEEIITKVNSILRGNVHDEIKSFKIRMEQASIDLNFEKAIEYRNIITSLENVSQRQKMETYIPDTDIFAYFANEEYLSIQVFHIRDNKMIERNGYLLENDGNVIEKYQEFVYNFYLVENNPLPKQIFICDTNEDELNTFNQVLNTKVIVPKIGKNLEYLNLVRENAKEKIDVLIKRRELDYQRTEKTFKDLSNLLGLEIHKIEAFDNSNIQGASPVSAMVVFIDGKKAPKLYRKFKVKTVVGANDVATMKEVVTRRYQDLDNPPDLIIMDGGGLQVNSCLSALAEIGKNIPVLGLVKDDNHKTRALYYNDKEISIEKGSYLFHMMEAIQEEVHRFAITFFRSTHTKAMFSSRLDEIYGIGKVKKNQILKILKEENFKEELSKLKLSDEQIKKVLEAYKEI